MALETAELICLEAVRHEVWKRAVVGARVLVSPRANVVFRTCLTPRRAPLFIMRHLDAFRRLQGYPVSSAEVAETAVGAAARPLRLRGLLRLRKLACLRFMRLGILGLLGLVCERLTLRRLRLVLCCLEGVGDV